MATPAHPTPTSAARTTPGGWASLLRDRSFWGGVSLVVIWLAVLFVGIFGGDIVTASSGGDSSSVPVVVVVAIAALLATVSVGRWAFTARVAEDDLRRETRRLAEEIEELRAELRSR